MENGKPKIDLDENSLFLRIYINDILHLSIKRIGFLGVQSWIDKDDKSYWIEYYHKDGNILTGYDDFENWKRILNLVDDAKIITLLEPNS